MSDALIPIAVFLGFLLAAIGSGFYVADMSQPERTIDVIVTEWSGQ